MTSDRPFYRAIGPDSFHHGDYHIESVQRSDAEEIRKWRNEQISALRQGNPLTREEQSAYFAELIRLDFPMSQPEKILVRFLYKDYLIGYGGIVHIDWHNLRGEVSFLLETSRTVHHAKYKDELFTFFELIKVVAFEALKLNKLTCEAYAHRQYHVEAIELAGFTREGILRQQTKINGVWIDAVVSSCLRSEYLNPQKLV
jgi:RimJ/RimL family protein N-acetyltransferase